MKTQIIQLHQNDDIVSVRDKMSWCQTGRILLIWPAHGQVLNRQLDLILAKRYASTLGSELALATHDAQVRFNALQIGIPVFANPRQAQEQEWGMSQQKKTAHQVRTHLPGLDNLRKSIKSPTPAWIETPVARISCLVFSMLSLVALAIFILPGAKVILSPKEEMQSINLDLTADPSATIINISTGSLPTYSQGVTVDGTDSITATGTMSIPDKFASGVLKFTNTSKANITLPTGTIVTTRGSNRMNFQITSLVSIIIKPKKSVLIDAQAVKPGSSGNLPPNSLIAVEGEFGTELAVTNPEATSGGLDAAVPTATPQDLQTLRDRLTTKLVQKALIELHSNIPSDDTLIPPSATISEILEETYYPTVGEPTEQVDLTLRLKIKTQVVSGEVLRSLVTPILDSNIPTGYSPMINSLVITSLTTPTLGVDGKTSWTVNANRKILADIPASNAIESIKGASVDQAAERLSASLPVAGQAKIMLVPSWWPRLPFLAMRITLVQADNQ